MRWITVRRLQQGYQLPWPVAERIIQEQIAAVRRDTGWSGVAMQMLWLGSMLWGVGGASWCFPHASGLALAGLQLPSVITLLFAAVIWPRLQAGPGIVRIARSYRGEPD